MMSKSKVPQIRFKGFNKEWEESKLNEKAFITMGQSPVSSSYNENSIGLPLIQGNADCKDRKTSPRIFASQLTKECFKDDIVMTVRAPVGYVSKSIHHACIGRGVCAIKPKEDTNFLFQFLINYENQWLKLSQGSTFTAVNSDDIKNLNITVPNEDEQSKIGDYFQQLDKLIEQKEKKYQKLKQFKKASLSKMFPKNGADTPEIRFKGFSGKWETFVFETIFERIPSKKYQINSNEYQDFGKYPVIDQGKKLIIGYSNNEERLYKNLSVIVFGDHTRELKYIDFDFIVGADGTQLIKTKTKFDNKFFYYQLQTKSIPNTGYNRHFKFLLEMNFISSSLTEQIKIGNYFQKLDNQIDLQQKELEKLKNIKKASLTKMFV